MNNELQLFGFEDQDVRVSIQNGEPWFVLKDVCNVLEIGNQGNVSSRLEEDEKADIRLMDTSSNGVNQTRSFTIINESGLYSVILRSDKPEARRFKKWITSEVIPSIRKTGGYLSPIVDFTNPENLMLILTNWKKDRERLHEVEETLIDAQPKIESHDALMRNKDHMSITECAQHFNLHPRAHVLVYLREHGYLKSKDLPTQRAIDRGYLVLRENRIPGKDMFVSQAVVLKKQLEAWRTKLVPRIVKEFDL